MSRTQLLRLAVVAIMVTVITVLHYVTNLHDVRIHDIYRRLYYVPIVLAGLWFALRGGVITALTVSVLFIPHVLFQWKHHPTVEPEQYLEIVLYNVIGILTGYLTGREREQQNLYRQTAQQLETSYAELRRQADQILEFEEQLRRADRLSALGELSAGLAHEIRNPLASIRGTAEILRDGIAAADPRAEFATILIREVDRLNRVVADFLDFSRPAGVSQERLDLVATVQEVLTLTKLAARKKRVELTLSSGGPLELVADGAQLKQAFLNLILNAFEAMPDGGTLRVSVTEHSGEIAIRFTDSGVGIAPQHLEQIFSPFFTTRRDGTGLGLAITQRIVAAHGGRIEVESQVGTGTTFSVILPIG
jgi:signal transduction histidine kinase